MQWFQQKNQLVLIPREVEPTKELTSFSLTEKQFAKTSHFSIKKNTTDKPENFPFKNRGKVVWGKGQQVNWTGDVQSMAGKPQW